MIAEVRRNRGDDKVDILVRSWDFGDIQETSSKDTLSTGGWSRGDVDHVTCHATNDTLLGSREGLPKGGRKENWSIGALGDCNGNTVYDPSKSSSRFRHPKIWKAKKGEHQMVLGRDIGFGGCDYTLYYDTHGEVWLQCDGHT